MYKLPEDMESKYRFVTIAALRAEQLQAGAVPRVESPSHKATVIAQQEVAQGAIGPFDPDAEVAQAEEAAESDEEE
jgi:DNA-directed RNA polymerase omega subunit